MFAEIHTDAKYTDENITHSALAGFQEQIIDDLIWIPQQKFAPTSHAETRAGDNIESDAVMVQSLKYRTALRDYTSLFSIATEYWGELQQSMTYISTMACACANHSSQTEKSISETTTPTGGVIYTSDSTSEHEHEHCKKCGECLKDGKCAKCR